MMMKCFVCPASEVPGMVQTQTQESPPTWGAGGQGEGGAEGQPGGSQPVSMPSIPGKGPREGNPLPKWILGPWENPAFLGLSFPLKKGEGHCLDPGSDLMVAFWGTLPWWGENWRGEGHSPQHPSDRPGGQVTPRESGGERGLAAGPPGPP